MKIQLFLKRPLTLGALVACALVAQTRAAKAHFLWAQIDTKTPLALHLSFAEGNGEMTNAVPLERLKTAVAWDGSGHKLALLPSGATLSSVLEPDSQIAAAAQTYGVLDKSEAGRGIFLLEYGAKAAKSVAQAGHNARLALELFARPQGSSPDGEILVTLKHNGKPVPFGAVTLHAPGDDKGRVVTTNAQGQLRFRASERGVYGLRASVAELKKGSFEDKKYDLVRRYTTLTFPVEGAVLPQGAPVQNIALALPPQMGNAQADPKAYALLQAAHDARQVLPESFAGYRAKVIFKDGDKTYNGFVVYNRKAEKEPILLQMTGLEAEAKAWLEDTVSNQIGHRRGASFAKGDGRNPMTWGNSENEFGALVKLNDRFNSEYRIKDGKVTEVTREMGDSRFTISVVETQTADAGKYLANHFMVTYRDKKSGSITQVDGFRDAYTQWNGFWLPATRIVVTFGAKETPRVRVIRYRDFETLGEVTR